MIVALVASISGETEPQEVSAVGRCDDLVASGVVVPDTAPEGAEPQIPGVVSGARNPELIPSLVAYRLFLRSLFSLSVVQAGIWEADPAAAGVREARHKQLMKTLEFGVPEEQALRRVVDGFRPEMEKLDAVAAAIKDGAWPDPDPSAVAALNDLQAKRDELVRQTIRSLYDRLGPAAARRIDRHVNGHVKRRIRMMQGPASAPAHRAPASE